MENKEHVLLCVMGRTACVDKDTEFFNGIQWKPINEYINGEQVLQYCDETNIAELVTPIRYIKQPCDYLYHFETKGTNQCLSIDHMLCYDYTGKSTNKHPTNGQMLTISMQDMIKRHSNNKHGFSGKFRTTFTFSGNGISLSDDEIRLMVAVIADGSFANNTNRCSFHFKKDRKKDRIRMLAHKCGIQIKEVLDSIDGYTNFYLYTPIKTKTFPKEWYQCTKHQFEVIWDEYKYWDGYFLQKNGIASYTSKHKSDADFMQFVASVNGYRSGINVDNRVGRVTEVRGKQYIWDTITYRTWFTSRTSVTIENCHESKCEINPYQTLDGYSYCFEVPSEKLVLRRDNKIFITHNCGKDSLVSKVCERSGLTQINSYTTRSRRENEGDTHIFTTKEVYNEMQSNGNIAAYTEIADNFYWTTIDQLYENDVYIIDYNGYKTLKELNLPNLRLVTVFINVPDEVRQERALNRRKDDKSQFRIRDVSERGQFREMLKNADFDYAISNVDFPKAYSILRWISTVEGCWKNIEEDTTE